MTLLFIMYSGVLLEKLIFSQNIFLHLFVFLLKSCYITDAVFRKTCGFLIVAAS